MARSTATAALALLLCGLSAAVPFPPPPTGNVSAVYALIERVVPGASSHFNLALSGAGACGGLQPPCVGLSDAANGQVNIQGSTASELSAGVGMYLRHWCNMTVGWPRGGGSHTFLPASWPAVGAPVYRRRAVPYSYIENVCTHSYSLVWYDWAAWEAYIDWAALSGINLVLAMTGQEEVQYQVFSQFGLDDTTIRTWFNGPAFLTWSRGQNEYGNNICGPLPRSWMKAQWALQKQILARTRSLGIVGELPGFQGNVPWALAGLQHDSNITQQGDTGWMFSTDPLFGKIADAWMQAFIEDFGTDHWYQLDGYFDGGTAPWRVQGAPLMPRILEAVTATSTPTPAPARPPLAPPLDAPACTWSSALLNTYLAGCEQGCESFATVAAAQAACAADSNCGGVTVPGGGGRPQLRAGTTPMPSPDNETSYVITNSALCHPIVPDSQWILRGAAAYEGLNRTDPLAVWSFQGWAIIDWDSTAQGSEFRGFVDAVPEGQFVVVDMSVDGSGEWTKWANASFFGAPFLWTTLHDFGGTDGMKGDLARINNIPFAGMAPAFPSTVVGTGYTPEGIDQNPVYYEFMAEVNFRNAPVGDIAGWAVDRAHRRYGLTAINQDVASAWTELVQGAYSLDLSVQDGTGIPHLPGSDMSQYESDGYTPTATLCATFAAWGHFINAAKVLGTSLEPFRYDLVNVGREILAQVSTPMSRNFSSAVLMNPLNPGVINATAAPYVALLDDVDALVGTDTAFLIGPWLQAARAWGVNDSDCGQPCPDFYEWNARTQLTTWNPVGPNDTSIPPGPIDYASKHWNGLVSDYYGARARMLWEQALTDAAGGHTLNITAVAEGEARLAFVWTNAHNEYPTQPVGDPLAASVAMYAKYSKYFAACAA